MQNPRISLQPEINITDYVFDGTTPPYAPSAVTNPLQAYGKSKRDGEIVVLNASEDGASVAVLRVPVLSVYFMIILAGRFMHLRYRYGPSDKNSDSAINILLDVVEDQSGKTYKMDHWAQRYPTNVIDIANFLVRFSGQYDTLGTLAHHLSRTCLPSIPSTFMSSCLTFFISSRRPQGANSGITYIALLW